LCALEVVASGIDDIIVQTATNVAIAIEEGPIVEVEDGRFDR
jgi:hypothetical protein